MPRARQPRRWRARAIVLTSVLLALALAAAPSRASVLSNNTTTAATERPAATAPPPPPPSAPDRQSSTLPWVWSWRNGLGLVAVALNAFTGAATGQSGSQILVPIAVLAAKMSVQDAAAFTAAVSAFGALTSLADALSAKHPLQPGERPSIDYPALALGMPALLLGVKLGTLFNKAAPAYLLTLLLVVLYGWGAVDLSLSYVRLLKRERERDALLNGLEQALTSGVGGGGGGEAPSIDAAPWEGGDLPARAAPLLPSTALGAGSAEVVPSPPPLPPPPAPSDDAARLEAERLALRRNLARLQEVSADILRREARGVNQAVLGSTLDADLLAAFRTQERAQRAAALPPSPAVDGSPIATNAPPLPLDALARKLLDVARERDDRGARIRRVRESALADERYLHRQRQASSLAAASDGGGRRGRASSSSAHRHPPHPHRRAPRALRLAGLRTAVSVCSLQGGSPVSGTSPGAGGASGSLWSGRIGGWSVGGGSPPSGGSPVRGTSPVRGGGSPGSSVLGAAGSGSASSPGAPPWVHRPVGGGGMPPSALGAPTPAPPPPPLPLPPPPLPPPPRPLERSAGDLLADASSPWLAALQHLNDLQQQPQQQPPPPLQDVEIELAALDAAEADDDAERGGSGSGSRRSFLWTSWSSVMRDKARNTAATISAATEDGDDGDDVGKGASDGCGVIDEEEGGGAEGEEGGGNGGGQPTATPLHSRFTAFFAHHRDSLADWWMLLPKLEGGVILGCFCVFLAFALAEQAARGGGGACSAASLVLRSAFAAAMIATTVGVVVVVLRRHRDVDDGGRAEAREEEEEALVGAPHGRHEAGLDVSPVLAALVPPCALSVGALGASVGASGSVIVQPIGLRLGVHPQIVSATSKILLFVSTAASSLSLTLAGRMNGSYALGYGLVTLACTPPGQWAADALVRKHGRPSLIVLVNILRYVFGVGLLVAVVLAPALVDGSPGATGFVSPCSA